MYLYKSFIFKNTELASQNLWNYYVLQIFFFCFLSVFVFAALNYSKKKKKKEKKPTQPNRQALKG